MRPDSPAFTPRVQSRALPHRWCLLLALAITMTLAGCSRTDDDRTGSYRGEHAPSTAAPSAPTSSPARSAPDTEAGDTPVTMRYACEQGHSVAVAGDEARVTLADGRKVAIARVEGSAPPRFAGEALSFSVNATGAVLGQDEVGGFDCTAD